MAPEGPGGSTENAKPKNTLAEMELEAARRIEDRRIDIIREGYEKERAEALLNFEREKNVSPPRSSKGWNYTGNSRKPARR